MKRILDQTFSADSTPTTKTAFLGTTFVPVGEHVIGWRTGTADPLADFDKDGTFRSIRVSMPKGTVLDSVVSSDKELIVRFRSASAGAVGDEFTDYEYDEVSPFDGKLLRKLLIDSRQVTDITCKAFGKFASFSKDKDGRFALFTAE